MASLPRRVWSIVVHHHEDGSFTVRVSVDARTLRPECVSCSASAALAYVEGALADVRSDDQLLVRVQSTRAFETLRATTVQAAKRWLLERPPLGGQAESGTRGLVPTPKDECRGER